MNPPALAPAVTCIVVLGVYSLCTENGSASAEPSRADRAEEAPPPGARHLRFRDLEGVGLLEPLADEAMLPFEREMVLAGEYTLLEEAAASPVIGRGRMLSLRDICPFGTPSSCSSEWGIGIWEEMPPRMSIGTSIAWTRTPWTPAVWGTTAATRRANEATVLDPSLGSLWTWQPHQTPGIDVAAEIPMTVLVSSTVPPDASSRELLGVANLFGDVAVPNADVLRIRFAL